MQIIRLHIAIQSWFAFAVLTVAWTCLPKRACMVLYENFTITSRNHTRLPSLPNKSQRFNLVTCNSPNTERAQVAAAITIRLQTGNKCRQHMAWTWRSIDKLQTTASSRWTRNLVWQPDCMERMYVGKSTSICQSQHPTSTSGSPQCRRVRVCSFINVSPFLTNHTRVCVCIK